MTWLHWSLLSALFAAVTAVLAKLGVRDIDPNLATGVRTSVVAILTWGIVAATPRAGPIGSVPHSTWVFLVLSGLGTGLSWLCYFHALQAGPLTRVAPVDKLSIALTILFGVALLGESLTWRIALGAMLIVAGVVTIALD